MPDSLKPNLNLISLCKVMSVGDSILYLPSLPCRFHHFFQEEVNETVCRLKPLSNNVSLKSFLDKCSLSLKTDFFLTFMFLGSITC